MVLEPPESVRKLQMALQAKAKGAPSYRFYLLYDKLYRKDVLQYAYDRCKANQGAPGVDKQDFADIAAYGEDRWLGELAEKLHRRTYRAEAVRRVWIPKAEGKKLRPLGIPRIADRVVMTAAMVVLEPIFEVDMPAEQHVYRPNLSAHTAVGSVNRLINEGHTRIIDADLADYFGSIPHAELLKSVARRVSDRHLLHLIKMWLEAPVEEDDGRGGKTRTTTARDTGRRRGLEARLGAKIVVYADDLVICCRGNAEEAMSEMRRLMMQLKLTVNEAKTHIRRLPQERFAFLGYDFGRYYSPKTGRAYLCPQPSKASVKRVIGKIRHATARNVLWLSAEEMVTGLNRVLVGWANYYSLGPVYQAYSAIDRYTPLRLRRWLRNKHKISNTGARCFSYEFLYDTLGLVQLSSLVRSLPRAKA